MKKSTIPELAAWWASSSAEEKQELAAALADAIEGDQLNQYKWLSQIVNGAATSPHTRYVVRDVWLRMLTEKNQNRLSC